MILFCTVLVGCAEKRAYSSSLDRKALMQLVFSAEANSKLQTLDFSELENGNYSKTNKVQAPVDPFFVVKVDDQFAVMLTGANPGDSDCHACQIVIGAYQFQNSDKGWYLIKRQDAVTITGESGQPGKIQMHKLAEGRYAFSADSEYCGQGLCTRSLSLIEVSKHGAKLVLDGIPVGYDIDGARGSCSAITATKPSEYITDDDDFVDECRQISGKWKITNKQLTIDFAGVEAKRRKVQDRRVHEVVEQRVVYDLLPDRATLVSGKSPLSDK